MTTEELREILIGALIDRDKRIRKIKSEWRRAMPEGLSTHNPYRKECEERAKRIMIEFDENFEIIRKDSRR